MGEMWRGPGPRVPRPSLAPCPRRRGGKLASSRTHLGAPEVRRGDGPEPLLPGRVPDLREGDGGGSRGSGLELSFGKEGARAPYRCSCAPAGSPVARHAVITASRAGALARPPLRWRTRGAQPRPDPVMCVFAARTCSLIRFPSISMVLILKSIPIVVMNVGLNESFAYRSSRHVLPTPARDGRRERGREGEKVRVRFRGGFGEAGPCVGAGTGGRFRRTGPSGSIFRAHTLSGRRRQTRGRRARAAKRGRVPRTAPQPRRRGKRTAVPDRQQLDLHVVPLLAARHLPRRRWTKGGGWRWWRRRGTNKKSASQVFFGKTSKPLFSVVGRHQAGIRPRAHLSDPLGVPHRAGRDVGVVLALLQQGAGDDAVAPRRRHSARPPLRRRPHPETARPADLPVGCGPEHAPGACAGWGARGGRARTCVCARA
jgi:hypothetical protein